MSILHSSPNKSKTLRKNIYWEEGKWELSLCRCPLLQGKPQIFLYFLCITLIYNYFTFFSNISGISLLGFPSEMYTFGTQLYMGLISEILSYIAMYILFLPLLFNLQVTSVYEYFQKRFNSTIRKLSSILFLIHTVTTLLKVSLHIFRVALIFNLFKCINLSDAVHPNRNVCSRSCFRSSNRCEFEYIDTFGVLSLYLLHYCGKHLVVTRYDPY